MKRINRIFALVLAIALLVPCVMTAQASSGKIWAYAKNVKIYTEKSTNAGVLDTLHYGEKIAAAKFSIGSKWTTVKSKKGTIGYILSKNVTRDNPNDVSLTIYTRQVAKVYQTPNYSSKYVRFKKGVKLSAVALTRDFSWWRIKYHGGYAYIPVTSCKGSGSAWFTDKNIWISTKHEPNKADILSYCEKVDYIGKSHDCTYFYFGDKRVGYVYSDDFDSNEPQAAETRAYAMADGAPLFSEGIFSNSYKVGRLSKNAEVTIMYGSDSFGLYKVKYNGKSYYMSSKAVNTEKKDSYIVEAKDNQELLSSRNQTIAKPIATVKKGDQLKLIKYSAAKVLVETKDGERGWMWQTNIKK